MAESQYLYGKIDSRNDELIIGGNYWSIYLFWPLFVSQRYLDEYPPRPPSPFNNLPWWEGSTTEVHTVVWRNSMVWWSWGNKAL